jgi:lysyl endopeptidase
LWFYQRSKCRSAPPSSIIQTAGGAKLKFKSPKVGTKNSTDHSLLRLRRDPPSGIALAGWSPDHFSTVVGKKVKGIHHPASDLKKISKGTVLSTGYVQGDFFFFSQTRVSHYVIQWKKGVVEGGSSGSGLWIGSDWPDQYLVGVLTGGASTCSERLGLDFYGMFSETYRRYPKVRRILDPQ